MDVVTWKTGDEIVIASTGHRYRSSSQTYSETQFQVDLTEATDLLEKLK